MSIKNRIAKDSERPEVKRRAAIAKAKDAVAEAAMDCWAHSLDPMPEFTPKMLKCCAELALLEGADK